MAVSVPKQHETFHGTWLRTRAVDGFILSETAYASGVELRRHSHERAGFCAVLEGGFLEYRSGNKRLYQPSDIIFRPPGEQHANRFLDAGGRCLNIEITGKQLQRLGSHSSVFARPADYQDGRLSALVMRIYRELQQADDVTHLAIEALVLELFIGIARSPHCSTNEPAWLPKVRELLQETFAEPFSLANIAAAVEIHPAHLARTFRRFHRQTVGDYVRHLRIEFARARLSSSADPISSIALAAGFYDQCHFTRTFKHQLGITPAEYRATFARRSSLTKPQS